LKKEVGDFPVTGLPSHPLVCWETFLPGKPTFLVTVKNLQPTEVFISCLTRNEYFSYM